MRCDMQHMFLFAMCDLIDEQLDIGRLDDPRRRCFEVIQENIRDNIAVIQKFLFSRRVLSKVT